MNDDKERTLWCGNLDEKVTEDILFQLFSQAGPVVSVAIPRSKNPSKIKRSFAFITFCHEISVSYAKTLFEGTSLYGKTLKLDGKIPIPYERDIFMQKMHGYMASIQQQSNNYDDSPRTSRQHDNYYPRKRSFERAQGYQHQHNNSPAERIRELDRMRQSLNNRNFDHHSTSHPYRSNRYSDSPSYRLGRY